MILDFIRTVRKLTQQAFPIKDKYLQVSRATFIPCSWGWDWRIGKCWHEMMLGQHHANRHKSYWCCTNVYPTKFTVQNLTFDIDVNPTPDVNVHPFFPLLGVLPTIGPTLSMTWIIWCCTNISRSLELLPKSYKVARTFAVQHWNNVKILPVTLQ